MARVSSRSIIVALLLILFVAALAAACGGAAPPVSTPHPAVTAGAAEDATPPVPEPTATDPAPTPTPTAEPNSSPEPTPMPELGQVNEANQWWDGAGWQALPEGEGWQVEVLEDGSVMANDGSGSMFWVEGQWLTEEQVETRKVVEYLSKNTKYVNRVSISGIKFSASDKLQKEIWYRLPEEIKTRGEKPFAIMVPDVNALQKVISSLSINVVGEGMVSLDGRGVSFSFISSSEDFGVSLPFFAGNGNDEFRYGAYVGSDGFLEVVIQLSNNTSTFYDYNKVRESSILMDGLILGLLKLSGSNQSQMYFEDQFMVDTEFDNYQEGVSDPDSERTWLVHPIVAEANRGYAKAYVNLGYYQMMDDAGWLPDEYRDLIIP